MDDYLKEYKDFFFLAIAKGMNVFRKAAVQECYMGLTILAQIWKESLASLSGIRAEPEVPMVQHPTNSHSTGHSPQQGWLLLTPTPKRSPSFEPFR